MSDLQDEIARTLCSADDSLYHHDRTDDYPCTLCKDKAAAVMSLFEREARRREAAAWGEGNEARRLWACTGYHSTEKPPNPYTVWPTPVEHPDADSLVGRHYSTEETP